MIFKQVNFFMLPKDERLFLSFVFKDPEVKLITKTNNQPNIREIDQFEYLKGNSQKGMDYLFWKQSFPIAQSDIKKVEYKRYDENIMKILPTGETGYVLDTMKTPVIEYMPSLNLGGGIINRGRIYADMYCVKDDVWQRREKAFESWYDRIARWLRRNFFKTSDSSFFYLGPTLLKLHQEGKVKYSWPYEIFNPEIGEILLKVA
jgi:hypothetical protein